MISQYRIEKEYMNERGWRFVSLKTGRFYECAKVEIDRKRYDA